MSRFQEMICTMKTVDYGEKKQFLQYLVRITERAKYQLSGEDQQELLAFAYEEVDRMLRAIPAAGSYKEKDVIFECENYLMGIIMHLSGGPDHVPQEHLMKIRALVDLVDKERYIETALDGVFEQKTVTQADVNRLLFWVRQCTDEYQKGKFFAGLAHYQKDMNKLDEGARQMVADYVAAELRRLPELDTQDGWDVLELIADVGKYFADEAVVAALQEVLLLGRNPINIYAIDTLCGMGKAVPQPVIDALARDPEYANMAYQVLRRQGLENQFPAELATEENLAKSDLIRWLTYPTELGKVPDEIVYLGKVKRLLKREVYHVFKFRSDSDTLDDPCKNQWLIGWSSENGGTFSNFDLYAAFEQETVEKTLRNIKKKLL